VVSVAGLVVTRRFLLALLTLVGWATLTAPALAQPASPELRSRAEQVIALLRGQGEADALFSPFFLAEIPPAQIRAVAQRLTAQYGAVQGLERIDTTSPVAGVLQVNFERALLSLSISLQPQPPHLVQGLLVTGAEPRAGDTLAAVIAEVRALPGQTAVAVARLGDGPPTMLAEYQPDRALAVGSTFKLFILAELSRQVQAGERRWSDVVALDRRSIPSGTLQTWPQGAPLTLHTLAALMISISDNTATDMLLHTLGREAVERMMDRIRIAAPERNRPFLSTLEAAALKSGPDAGVAAWRAADEAGRRRLLAGYAAADANRIDVALFAGNPRHIDSVEWFVSPSDLVRTMDWLRRNGDDTARAILAINPGIGPAQRGPFAYVGYKGGSEPGVLNLTWLVQDRAGVWHAISGSWNDPAAPLDEARFVGLMTRAVQLVRQAERR
jgi:beta-lactamase class A